MSAAAGVLDFGPRLEQRRRELAHQRVARTSELLAADSLDGEWWAIKYLLASIRAQAHAQHAAKMTPP